MKKLTTLSLPALSLMLIAGTAVTGDALAAADTDSTAETSNDIIPQAPSGVDLDGYKLVWSDEFNETSWSDKSPKDPAKWYTSAPLGSLTIGFQIHDSSCMTIKDGVMSNTLEFKSAADVAGSNCAGVVGMKDDSGAELVAVDKLGGVKHGDDRLMWKGVGWVGMKFTTPADGLTVGELGLYNIEGNTDPHEIRIFDAATGDDVAKATVETKGKQAGWIYAPIVGGSKKLEGNHAYCLMCWQLHHDGWYDGQTTVTPAGGITVNESEWGNWHTGSLFSMDTTGAGFLQQYGYWEIKAKLPASGLGKWPSFCLYSKTRSGLNEEVDIFEDYGGAFDQGKNGGFGMRNHNWGSGGPKQGSADSWPPISKPWDEWHIYGFLATPTKCAFYVDGDKKAEYDTPTAYQREPMFMTLEYNTGGGWPLTGLVANSHMDVDWVRVWALPDK